MNKTIGIFGVTANPPHYGHMQAIEKSAKVLDEVWISPVYVHPFGKEFINYEHRVTMLKMLLDEANIENAYLKHLDKEFFEEKNEMVFSYSLLKFLKNKYQYYDFKLIIGEDNEKIFDKFKYGKEIIKEFGLYVVKDKGFHSTDIRNAIKNNKDTNATSQSVLDYIKTNNLYEGV